MALRQDATSKEYFVDLEYVAQTLQQMRRQTPLTVTSPPARERLVLRGCGTVAQPRCPWSTFERIVEGAIDPAFTLASNDPPERAPQVRR